jgi:hypothetical protein
MYMRGIPQTSNMTRYGTMNAPATRVEEEKEELNKNDHRKYPYLLKSNDCKPY